MFQKGNGTLSKGPGIMKNKSLLYGGLGVVALALIWIFLVSGESTPNSPNSDDASRASSGEPQDFPASGADAPKRNSPSQESGDRNTRLAGTGQPDTNDDDQTGQDQKSKTRKKGKRSKRRSASGDRDENLDGAGEEQKKIVKRQPAGMKP